MANPVLFPNVKTSQVISLKRSPNHRARERKKMLWYHQKSERKRVHPSSRCNPCVIKIKYTVDRKPRASSGWKYVSHSVNEKKKEFLGIFHPDPGFERPVALRLYWPRCVSQSPLELLAGNKNIRK
jgi:hypothetical protein